MGLANIAQESFPVTQAPGAGRNYIGFSSSDGLLKTQNNAGTVTSYASTVPQISGSRGSPTSIVAAAGITPPGGYNQLMYIQGSAGNVDIVSNPQIAAGTNDGELLELRGRNASQKVLIEDGTGLSLNGSFNIGADDSITLRWDTSNWVEVSRRENA